MRFQCRIYFEKGSVFPSSYRQYFLSLIKEAILNSADDAEQFYEKYYSSAKIKPFTFSLYIPAQKVDDGLRLNAEYINFYFSSFDFEFLMRVYNGLLNISNREEKFTLGKNTIKSINNFYIHQSIEFSDSVSFKTLSPFLLRYPEDGDYYLIPDDINFEKKFKVLKFARKDEFIDALKINIISIIKNFFNFEEEKANKEKDVIQIEDLNLTVSPVVYGSKNKDNDSFKTTYPGLKGTLIIKTKPEYLKLLYDTGIGARRSEGFGMVDVVLNKNGEC